MARKPRRLDHLDYRDPSFKQIAQGLKSKLGMKGIDPGPDRNAEDVEDGDRNGGIITLSYGEFYEMAGCKQLRKRLYTEVELEASRIGIAVAFGWNAIIVATDDNFAPESWSTFANESRPVHPVEYAPKRPKPKLTEAQKQPLFNRVGKNKKASP